MLNGMTGGIIVTYLITLLSAKQSRRIRVIENILHNKRTVTTLFWGMRYQILPWLGSMRQLERADFDAQLSQLVAAGLANISQNQVLLSSAGYQAQLQFWQHHQRPQFLKFYLLGDIDKMEKRVLLAGQVLSEYSFQNKKYAPLSFDGDELRAVKLWFHQQNKSNLVFQFKQELTTFLSTLGEQQANFLVMQLVGHEVAGWSTEQAAEQLELPVIDATMVRRDLWAGLTGFFVDKTGPMHDLIAPLIQATPLSHSTQITYELFNRGYSIEQICRARHLKLSTIREHLLEVAIFLPRKFPFQTFLSDPVMQQLEQHYQGNVDQWQFNATDKSDGQSFFYFRLFQIMRSYQEYAQ